MASTDRVATTKQGVFDIADHDIDPFKCFMIKQFEPTPHNNRKVETARFANRSKRAKPSEMTMLADFRCFFAHCSISMDLKPLITLIRM